MKKYRAILLLSFLNLSVFAQDGKEISAILDRQISSWNAGNLELYMQDYWKSDSLLYVGKSGPKYGWQTALDNYRRSYPDKAAMGKLDLHVLKIDFVDKKNAFVMGRWHLKRNKDEPQGYFTLLVRRFPEGWKIIADHSS